MPGWGIAANLTPPELIASRRLRRVKERLVMAILVIVLLAAGGYAYAFWQVHTAQGGLQSAEQRTAQLRSQETQYSVVTTLQGNIGSVRHQIQKLMAGDVDVSAVLTTVEHALPPGVAITELTLSMDGASAGAPAGGNDSLDTSGKLHVGQITLQGTGRTLVDASTYVAALAALPGVVDVFPTSNVTQAVGTQFALTVNLTDSLLSHRFDVTGAPGAGK
jgi:hypothetical protein